MSSAGNSLLEPRPRVLVTYGTKLGGTEGIARMIGDVLELEGFDVDVEPARKLRDLSAYRAAIIGGAIYANRWHKDARRFVDRHVTALRHIPVWMFSSGPLDDSADKQEIAPVTQAAVRLERIGGQGHVTFGGRLERDVKGFPAAAMAKTHSGDWRNLERIRVWARAVARAIPEARPRTAIDHPARAPARLIAHAVAGWALCAAVILGLLQIASTGVAFTLHALAAPLIFTAVAARYFRGRGARDPVPTALAFAAIVAALDAVIVAGMLQRSFAMFASFVGTWLPFGLIFLATWFTGFVSSTMPWPKPPAKADSKRARTQRIEHHAAGER